MRRQYGDAPLSLTTVHTCFVGLFGVHILNLALWVWKTSASALDSAFTLCLLRWAAALRLASPKTIVVGVQFRRQVDRHVDPLSAARRENFLVQNLERCID